MSGSRCRAFIHIIILVPFSIQTLVFGISQSSMHTRFKNGNDGCFLNVSKLMNNIILLKLASSREYNYLIFLHLNRPCEGISCHLRLFHMLFLHSFQIIHRFLPVPFLEFLDSMPIHTNNKLLLTTSFHTQPNKK